MQPQENRVSYFLDGNATGCVNPQSTDAEAENYLGQAKEIDGQPAYAFKSLGTSLEGQGDLVGAAWAYLEATKADASDLRAFRLLERLLADHPQLISQCPWLIGGLKVCHKIVEDALDA